MIRENDIVVLKEDITNTTLVKDDMGTVVHVYAEEKGYEVEFVSADGKTIAVETLPKKAIRAFKKFEILHSRSLATA